MKLLRMLAIAVLALAGISASLMARADNIGVSLTFQSGATFSGTIDFSDHDASILGVDGTLTGYQYGTYGYAGSGSDSISWIWVPGTNFASDSDDYGNFLMDGIDDVVYFNWIAFTYNYAGAPNLLLAPGDSYGVEIDYDDPMVSGSIDPAPEPDTILLLGSGLIGLAAMLRRKIAPRA